MKKDQTLTMKANNTKEDHENHTCLLNILHDSLENNIIFKQQNGSGFLLYFNDRDIAVKLYLKLSFPLFYFHSDRCR